MWQNDNWKFFIYEGTVSTEMSAEYQAKINVLKPKRMIGTQSSTICDSDDS